MKRFILGFLGAVIFIGSFCIFADNSNSEVSVLMLYWRGKTKCSEGFKSGLKDLNVKYTEFNAKMNEEALTSYLDSVSGKKFDLVYAFGTTVAKTASQKMPKTPVLAGIVADPVAAGLIKSWKSSGNNITAVSHLASFSDQVNFITKLGKFKKAAMIFNPREENSVAAVPILGRLFSARSIEFPTFAVNNQEKIDKAIEIMKKIKIDIVYLPSDSYIIENAGRIIPKLTQNGILSYGSVKVLIDKGAAIGIVSSYFKVGEALSVKAKKILKGASPSSIPSFRLPLKDQTVMYNAKTVAELKYIIPESVKKKAVPAGQ
jgi:putative ABC transport system substrate-binding protein